MDHGPVMLGKPFNFQAEIYRQSSVKIPLSKTSSKPYFTYHPNIEIQTSLVTITLHLSIYLG